jgi:hypothetical protein
MHISHRFICYTLFDITATGISNRNKPSDNENIEQWAYKRNTQCNFDTVLQAISLRSQPEFVTSPIQTKMTENKRYFGVLYGKNTIITCWKFTFDVQHSSVFADETNILGGLYKDVDNVPMIICGTEIPNLSNFLITTPDLKNIHFESVQDA